MPNAILIVAALLGIVGSLLTIFDKLPRRLNQRSALWVSVGLFGLIGLSAFLLVENRVLKDTRAASEEIAGTYNARSIGKYGWGQMGEIIGTAVAVSAQLGECHSEYNATVTSQYLALPDAAGFDFNDNDAYELARGEYEALAGFSLAFLEGVAAGRILPCD